MNALRCLTDTTRRTAVLAFAGQTLQRLCALCRVLIPQNRLECLLFAVRAVGSMVYFSTDVARGRLRCTRPDAAGSASSSAEPQPRAFQLHPSDFAHTRAVKRHRNGSRTKQRYLQPLCAPAASWNLRLSGGGHIPGTEWDGHLRILSWPEPASLAGRQSLFFPFPAGNR